MTTSFLSALESDMGGWSSLWAVDISEDYNKPGLEMEPQRNS